MVLAHACSLDISDAGSTVVAGTDCDSAAGASCTLSFPADVVTRLFLVSARFEYEE